MQLPDDAALRWVEAVRPFEELEEMDSGVGPSIRDGHVSLGERDHDLVAPHPERHVVMLAAGNIEMEAAPNGHQPGMPVEVELGSGK